MSRLLLRPVVLCAHLLAMVSSGCSSKTDDPASGAAAGSGGAPASSGAAAFGATPAATGGSPAGGGSASGGAALGGSPTGGALQGGTPNTGGASTGGNPTGGNPAVGGDGAGGASTGGSPTTGGDSSGGNPTTGGDSSGGSPTTGGDGTGGNPTTGGDGGSTGTPEGGTGGVVAAETSADLVAGWTLGWNLGNSLDAPEGETTWGNPTVTRELFETVAEAGFDVVRIPVTWSLHLGAGPDYLIDAEFLDRVTEVVEVALDSSLDVIINLHHDGADAYDGVEWITLNDASGAVTNANNTAVRVQFVAVWRQLASHFAGFDSRLLFESMNEIHDGYDAPEPAYYDIINDLNQAFVDTVRAGGGNNPERHLVVPGYNTNIDYTVAGFQAPVDPTPSRLILSVHYYDPWDYAGAGNTHTWGAASPGSDSWGQEDYVASQFDKLKSSFGDRGLPVVIGEYGAVQQDGYDDYRRYFMEYVTKAAVDRGILPIYWDNGGEGTGGDAFGLFDRSSYSSLHPSILEAMMRAATESYALADVAPPSP
ncbi:MAG: glycoside hydrolase family 5 protein [Polyangiaceae bacterium]|nr:glycoside hydrolase family 5 protein [Polyangiaceae bacterium]